MVWVFIKQPVTSVVIVSAVDMLAFGPTIRKSWNKPYTETLSSYIINTVRFGLGLFALEHYSVITYLYPLTWFVANGLFSILLVIRRRKITIRAF